MFDSGLKRSLSCGVPVISVGNIAVGGTGKTPFVIELVKRIQKLFPGRGLKIGVVSRGYGRTSKGYEIVSDGRKVVSDPFSAGDEPYLIATSCRGTVVVVDEDRVRGASAAVEQFKTTLILLDDGFQHRRLKRDLDIVLLDGRNPFGNRMLLPAGVLRESIGALERADLVVLSKSEEGESELQDRVTRMSEYLGRSVIATRVKPTYWKREGKGEIEGLEQIRGKRVTAFAGIAYPASFFRTVEELGGEIVERIPLPDHCDYRKLYLDKIARLFVSSRSEWLVTTMKDAAKLPPILKILPVYGLQIEHDVVSGGELLDQMIWKTYRSS
jgi:tetraacyldisaccharide 4'-kinase